MTTSKTVREWAIMLLLCSMMIGAAFLVRNALTGWDQETVVAETANACWFLSEKVERVLSSDLEMWTNHLDHNPSALMSEWFDIRLAEVTILYSSKGVTEMEVAMCLDSLALTLAEELP